MNPAYSERVVPVLLKGRTGSQVYRNQLLIVLTYPMGCRANNTQSRVAGKLGLTNSSSRRIMAHGCRACRLHFLWNVDKA